MILPRMCLMTVVKPAKTAQMSLIVKPNTVTWRGRKDNAVFDVPQSGVQIFTVQSTATYYIYAYGAAGGMTEDGTDNYGGRGASVRTVSLTAGDEVMIVVGQKGEDGTGTGNSGDDDDQAGGGGGTFVFKKANSVTTPSLLLVAGGGGGAGKNNDGQGGMAGNDGGKNPVTINSNGNSNGYDGAADGGTNGGDDGDDATDNRGKGGTGCSSSTCTFTGEGASSPSRKGGFGGGGKGNNDCGGGGSGCSRGRWEDYFKPWSWWGRWRVLAE